MFHRIERTCRVTCSTYFLLASFVFVACSELDPATGVDADGVADSGLDAGERLDATAVDASVDAAGDAAVDPAVDAAAVDAAVDAPALMNPSKSGVVLLSQTRTSIVVDGEWLDLGEITAFGGAFHARSLEELLSYADCTVDAREGECLRARCAEDSFGPADVTLHARTEDGDSWTHVADGEPDVGEAVVQPGERVTISSVGDSPPAFSADVMAPPQVSAIFPETMRSDEMLILPLTYEGTASAETLYSVVSAGDVLVTCLGEPGPTLTIPASLLRDLPTGAGVLSVSTRNSAVLDAGEYRMQLIVAHAHSALINVEAL